MTGTQEPKSPTIEARALRVDLAGRRVLDDVSVALTPGSLTALVGPNGAGKSTLLRALADLVPLAGGDVRLGGVGTEADGARRSRLIAFLPQDRTVHWDLTVAHVVALGRLAQETSPRAATAADRAAVDAAMRRMDIAHLAGRPIQGVSGGERARVLIARALAQETAILLADEPVAGLDPAHQLALFELLRELAREGRTVLVALHDLSLALRFADRLVALHEGRVAADGSPRAALSPEVVARIFGIQSRVADIDGVPVLVPLGPAPPAVR